MDNYTVQFVFDYAVITAACYTENGPDAAESLAWDWVIESGIAADRADCIDVIVTEVVTA